MSRPRIVELARRALAVTAGLMVLAGCARSPATRFYALTPLATASDPAPAAATGVAVGIRSIDLPAALDRPQIMTRTGENTIAFAEFDRWSAPLSESVARVLAENLAVRLASERVVVYPWPPAATVDHEVIVDVIRFDGRLGGSCVLDARWRVVTRAPRSEPIVGRSSLREAAGGDYAALVAAQSRLVDALSAEIASAIRSRATITRQRAD